MLITHNQRPIQKLQVKNNKLTQNMFKNNEREADSRYLGLSNEDFTMPIYNQNHLIG